MPRGVYKTGATHGQTWPDHVVETVQTELANGASFKQVFNTVRAKHPSFITTRNAIIGKAHRMGWTSQHKMRNEEGVRDALEKRKADPRIRVKPPKYVKEETTLLREDNRPSVDAKKSFRRRTKEEIEIAKQGHIPAIVEITPRTSKPFADLKRGECKWPTAIDASMACGRTATCGSYCDDHASIAYRVPPTRKRHASIGKEQDIDRARRREIDADAEATIAHFLDSRDVPGISDHRRSGDDLGSHVVGAFIGEVINNDD